MTTIYLAHPIDLANPEQRQKIQAQKTIIQNTLIRAGATAIYTPADAWRAQTPMPASIQHINSVAVLNSDAVLALLPIGTTTLGVPFELGIAYGAGIPCVVIRGEHRHDTTKTTEHSALLSMLAQHGSGIYSESDIDHACNKTIELAKQGQEQQ